MKTYIAWRDNQITWRMFIKCKYRDRNLHGRLYILQLEVKPKKFGVSGFEKST